MLHHHFRETATTPWELKEDVTVKAAERQTQRNITTYDIEMQISFLKGLFVSFLCSCCDQVWPIVGLDIFALIIRPPYTVQQIGCYGELLLKTDMTDWG